MWGFFGAPASRVRRLFNHENLDCLYVNVISFKLKSGVKIMCRGTLDLYKTNQKKTIVIQRETTDETVQSALTASCSSRSSIWHSATEDFGFHEVLSSYECPRDIRCRSGCRRAEGKEEMKCYHKKNKITQAYHKKASDRSRGKKMQLLICMVKLTEFNMLKVNLFS